MNRLAAAQRAQVVKCLVDGTSIRATGRITGVAKNTVTKLLIELGAACLEYHARTLRNLNCKRIQVDECWAFCYAKAKNVTPKIAAKNPYAGDAWTWAAIDADSKLIPCWLVGQRGRESAEEFIGDLAERLNARFGSLDGFVQITSDALAAYAGAIFGSFGNRVDYAQLHKVYKGGGDGTKGRYSPAECIGAYKTILGHPDPSHISTSSIERQNLNLRMGMRRFTRLTNAFSKKIENHAAAISLHMMYHNFSRVQQTLGTTPAVAAGIADHVWSIEEIVALLEHRQMAAGVSN